eukprot:TRINITY_DN10860_c0_g2_i7.p2 TRINITY_DN10860_c0_g2~~TRINITY_DN10860_c0_g2_i7.p2  ORF type:complete len:422 (-),score=158.11 TRINITY_DN10860_c0_g2_i7:150-1415(-)
MHKTPNGMALARLFGDSHERVNSSLAASICTCRQHGGGAAASTTGSRPTVVQAYTELGEEAARANGWSQGAFVLDGATLTALDGRALTIRARVTRRTFFGRVTHEERKVRVALPWAREVTTAEGIKRCLMEMSRRQGLSAATATIYNMPVGSYSGLPKNLRLNNVPHSRLARAFIYRGACAALFKAIDDDSFSRRMTVRCTVPELNFEMDTYRVGTMLELVREMATGLADEGKRVKVCVQGSMGVGIFTGLPLSLSGTRAIMERMDWGEGYVGASVNFGKVGAEFVDPEDDVIMIIAPQSIVGASIHESLSEMARAAGGRPIVLVNPNLKDRPSSGGIMSVRGRGDRLEFAASFQDAFHFRLVYPASAAMFPIKGAVMKSGPNEPYVLFRRDEVKGGGEEYVPLATFDDNPQAEQINPFFR